MVTAALFAFTDAASLQLEPQLPSKISIMGPCLQHLRIYKEL